MISCGECMTKCKGECCTWVPLSIKFIKEHENKIQRKILCFEPHKDRHTVVYPIVEFANHNGIERAVDVTKQKCIFLDNNNRCAVYNDRPEICRLFGTTHQPDNTLTCHYHLGKEYSFPKDNTPEKELIDRASMTGKYIDQLMTNKKLVKELMGL